MRISKLIGRAKPPLKFLKNFRKKGVQAPIYVVL
nr:MAG TPA: hypothetical protein [Caudoviricetes sp.]